MTNLPPPQPALPPLGYESPLPGARPPRPGVVTALAIVGIVLASVSILMELFFLAAWSANPLIDPGHFLYMIPRLFIPLALAALLLGAAIATLCQSPLGRIGMITWSWITIVLASLGILRPFLHLPYALFLLLRYQSFPIIRSPFVSLIPLGYAIWAVITLHHPRVKSAFTRPAGNRGFSR